MMSEEKNQIGFQYSMPNGIPLKIFSSKPLTLAEEVEMDMNEKTEGLHYYIQWGEKKFPFSMNTQLQANLSAMAAQWGASNR